MPTKYDILFSNPKLKKTVLLWLPVAFFMGVIFYASSLPGKDIPPLFPFQDLAFHIGVYSMLGFFFKRALKHTYPAFTFSKALIITIIFGLGWGLSDEFHQFFVPSRSVSAIDLLLDGVGSLLGGLVYR